MTRLRLDNADGTSLEARWDAPEQPLHAAVFCHPHPLYGGTMRGPLMAAVTQQLVAHECAVLRFNFRGVGASTGEHDGGVAELTDVDTAVGEMQTRYADLPHGIVGWSFGAAVALKWHVLRRATFPYVGIAPPIPTDLPPAQEIEPASRLLVLGERDTVVGNDAAAAYGAAIGARVEVIGGADHFFALRERDVGAAVAEGLTA